MAKRNTNMESVDQDIASQDNQTPADANIEIAGEQEFQDQNDDVHAEVPDQIKDAVAQGAAELDQALNAHQAVLIEDGIVSTKPQKDEAAADKPARQPLTPAAKARLAKRQRESGERLLAQKLIGSAVVKEDLRINHSAIANQFMRTIPFLDQAGYLLDRFGSFALAGKAKQEAQTLADAIEKFLEQVNEDARVASATLEMEAGKIAEKGDAFITPQYTSQISTEFEIKSPLTRKAIEAFRKADETIVALDALHWNGIRSADDISDWLRRFRGDAKVLALKVFRLTRDLRTAYRSRMGG